FPPRRAVLVPEGSPGQFLDRHGPLELSVESLPHGAHLAAAEPPYQLIAIVEQLLRRGHSSSPVSGVPLLPGGTAGAGSWSPGIPLVSSSYQFWSREWRPGGSWPRYI